MIFFGQSEICHFQLGPGRKSCQANGRILAGLHSRERLKKDIGRKDIGRILQKDPVREAKFVGLLCNSLVLSRIKSIFDMEVIGISHIPRCYGD